MDPATDRYQFLRAVSAGFSPYLDPYFPVLRYSEDRYDGGLKRIKERSTKP